MKIVIGADLHIHPHPEFDTFSPESDRLKDGLRALLWLGSVAKREGAPLLVIAGDLFHRRHQVSVKCYDAIYDTLQTFEGDDSFTTYLLAGNHDQSSYEDTALRPLQSEHILPIEKPQRVQAGFVCLDFIPYVEDPDDFRRAIKDLEATGRLATNAPHYLITHQSVAGARKGTFEYCPPHSISVLDIPGYYDHVFSGHFHPPQTLMGRFTYVGSPMQLDRSDRGAERGCVVLDTKEGAWEFVPYQGAPKFIELRYPEYDFEWSVEYDFVDVVYPHGTKRADVVAWVEALKPRSYRLHVDPETIPSPDVEEGASLSSLHDPSLHLCQYLDAQAEMSEERRGWGLSLLQEALNR